MIEPNLFLLFFVSVCVVVLVFSVSRMPPKVADRNLPAHVVVSTDGSNYVEMEGVLFQLLDLLSVSFLRYNEWNMVTDKRSDSDEVSKLRAIHELKTKGGDDVGSGGTEGDYAFVPSDPLVASMIGESYFLDPVTKDCESSSRRTARIIAWTWLSACMINHKHMLESVDQYALSRVLNLLRQSFGTGSTQIALKSVRDMTSLKLGGQPDAWSALCPKIALIAAAQKRISNPKYRLPPAFLPAFVLSALDDDPRYAIAVSDLRKLESSGGSLTVEAIVAKINVRAAQIVGSAGGGRVRGAVADARQKEPRPELVVPPGRKVGECWSFAKHVKCRFGDGCRFTHDAAGTGAVAPRLKSKPQGCYECGKLTHSFTECPDRKLRADADGVKIAASVAAMKAMRAEIDEMKKTLAATGKSVVGPTGKIAGSSAIVDPYHAGTEFSSLFRAPGGPDRP